MKLDEEEQFRLALGGEAPLYHVTPKSRPTSSELANSGTTPQRSIVRHFLGDIEIRKQFSFSAVTEQQQAGTGWARRVSRQLAPSQTLMIGGVEARGGGVADDEAEDARRRQRLCEQDGVMIAQQQRMLIFHNLQMPHIRSCKKRSPAMFICSVYICISLQ